MIVFAALLAFAAPVWAAATPEQSCQGGKNELVGKYAGCRAKAEKKLVVSIDHTAYSASISKCQEEYAARWAKLDAKATAAGGEAAVGRGDLQHRSDDLRDRDRRRLSDGRRE